MPMRIPLTPPLPTAILFCELATTVSGSSTTTRAGELSLLTRGVTVWLELISIWMLSPRHNVHVLELVVLSGGWLAGCAGPQRKPE